jgi:hypothetical protein
MAATTVYRITRALGNKTEQVLRLRVPATWRVTFAPVVPGQKGAWPNGPYALRFYEGQNKQRALIQNVVEFYDESIEFLSVEDENPNIGGGGVHAVVPVWKIADFPDPGYVKHEF